MSDLIVKKFGGSCIDKIREMKFIIQPEDIIVVSAPGKRSLYDEKVTDLLIQLYYKIKNQENYFPLWGRIKCRYTDILKLAKVDFDMSSYFDEIERCFDNALSKDVLISRGEYLTAVMFAKIFNKKFVDAKDCIVINDEGLDMNKSCLLIRQIVTVNSVLPGFYGIDKNGEIKTMSRSGSDITGSILSVALGANRYENWTDQDGVKIASPQIVKSSKSIDKISYNNMAELAKSGAEVLHSKSIEIAQSGNVPIIVRSIYGDNYKTTVSNNDDCRVIKGMAGYPYSYELKINNLSYDKINELDGVLRDYGLTVDSMKVDNKHLKIYAHILESQDYMFEKNLIKKITNMFNAVGEINSVSQISLILGELYPDGEVVKKILLTIQKCCNSLYDFYINKNKILIIIDYKDYSIVGNRLYYDVIDNSINDKSLL